MLRELPDQPSTEEIQLLVAALGTERWSLRERIADRVAKAGPRVVPLLLDMLETGLWFSRAATLKALGRVADPRALLPTLEACWDKNQTVSEEALRALVGYCRRGYALAVAKILHSRGPVTRSDLLDRLAPVDPESARKLERLWGEKEIMGAEARLRPEDELELAQHVRDGDWGLRWDSVIPSEPLSAEKRSVMGALREQKAPPGPAKPLDTSGEGK
jgi:hypothetical protein